MVHQPVSQRWRGNRQGSTGRRPLPNGDSARATRDNGDGLAAAVKIVFRMLRGGRSIPWGCGGRYPQPKGSLPPV